MWWACQEGHFEIVQWLHVHGADMDVMRPRNDGTTPMWWACQEGHFEIARWLHAHGAATDVTRPTWRGKTPMDIACSKGHLNIVKHLIHHHKMSPDTLAQWHPRLSTSNKHQLCQAARENIFHCQSFFTLALIVCRVDIEPYKVMNEETGCLVVPRSSILRFRNIDNHVLLDRIAHYICGGKDTRQMWFMIRNLRRR